jgi:hypothetical protein
MRRAIAALLLAIPIAVSTQSAIRSPEAFFGFRMGTDRELADWTQIQSYFAEIATASDRVELIDACPTTDGHRIAGAIVSAPENIRRLEEIRTATLRLADPRTLAEGDALALAATMPVVVAIGASIHATEIGATQAANELLHTLATTSAPELVEMLRHVVVILLPSLNPDGHSLTVDWYRRWKGGDFEGSPMPWLYHRYVGHDINRDAFMMNMAENRTLADFFYRRWHPQVFLSMHQMGSNGPRFFVPPNYDPIDPNYDPLIWRTAGLLGHAMALRMEQDGQQGVVQNAMYDYYWPGYEDSAPLGHNTVCLLTEVASVRVATPIRVDRDALQGTSRGLPEYRAQINFPNPWPGGSWTLRDIVDYDLSAAHGLLQAAARYREDLLVDFYRMGQRAVDAGRRGGPFAFVIPSDQFDPRAAQKLRQLLLDGAIEIERATEPFRAGTTSYPAGTDLVLMAQPFRAYVKTLLEQQIYPTRRAAAGTAPERPYDVAGWTLPLQMGVSVDRYDTAFTLPASTRLTTAAISGPAIDDDRRRATHYIIDGRGTGASIAINRLQAAGFDVSWTTDSTTIHGYSYEAGALVVGESGAARMRSVVERLTKDLGLHAAGISGAAPRELMKLGRVRVGLYKPWVENIDEGWTRWLLEQYEFPFVTLTDQDIRRGGLAARLDVIIVPDQSAERLMNGHPAGTMPPEYTGGLGSDGALALKQFVDAGGTLVALDSACELAINALGLPVQNVLAGARPEEFFAPGSLLRLTLDPAVPLNYGLRPETAAFFAFSSAFSVTAPQAAAGEPATAPPTARIVGRYGTRDVLLSGWLEGEARIAGQGAVVEARSGQGRAVLLGFRAQHRGQSHATFRLLFNAIHTAAHALPRSRAGTRDGG